MEIAMLVFTVGFLLAALIYFVVTTLFEFPPLNNVSSATSRERAMEVAVNAPLLSAPVVLVLLASTLQIPVLSVVGGVIELLIALAGLSLWWLPYIAGVSVPWATSSGETWDELHARTYAHTLIILPPRGDRPRPNVEHMILHALLVTGSILAFASALTVQR